MINGRSALLAACNSSPIRFGFKYPDPLTSPGSWANGVEFSPAGNAIAVCTFGAPFIHAYAWSSSGFGQKYFDPGTPINNFAADLAFTPSGDAIIVGHDQSPGVTAYRWSTAGFGQKFLNPSTGLGNIGGYGGHGVAFNPAGNAVVVTGSNFDSAISAYAWSSSGFGSKYSNPSTWPGSTFNAFPQNRGVEFSPSGDAIIIGKNDPPGIYAYGWSASGFSSQFFTPATPAFTVQSSATRVAFHPSGNAVAVAFGVPPFVAVYQWSSGGFGTKYADPKTLPPNAGQSVKFSRAGDAIIVGGVGNRVSAYEWTNSGFGEKYADPSPLPAIAGPVNDVAFNPADDTVAFATSQSPHLLAYQWLPLPI